MSLWSGAGKIRLHGAWCKGCGICVAVCPRAALKLDEFGKVQVADENACTACRLCEIHCPDFAIVIALPPARNRK